MAGSKIAFTKTALSKLAAPEKGRVYVHDSKMPGLSLCTTSAGTKTFYWYRWLAGKPVRVQIDKFPEMTVEQARKLAAKINVDAAQGTDPQQRKRDAKEEMTFGDLFTRWLEYSMTHKRTWAEDQRKIDKHLSAWRNRRLPSIRRETVQALHTRMGKENGRYSANRVLELVRSLFVMAINDLVMGLAFRFNRRPAHSV